MSDFLKSIGVIIILGLLLLGWQAIRNPDGDTYCTDHPVDCQDAADTDF